ncbi:hypothetical protein BDN70DRAFT_468106 [Pholiota conissans]|uniref:C2H2-type domain-containing protein n=1 Tax=Pholiota conissans TaxID=109636 RepID=A0A9P5Z9X3_9AGAR|nr:hypothetical protein BDN70DRAFT_468106 [Pholiota conissans]
MAQYPQDDSFYNPRPTLPPIRQLFRDELGRRSNTPHESPSLTLARLRVTDEEEYTNPSAISSRQSQKHVSQPLYGVPSSSGYSEPSSYTRHSMASRDPHSNPPVMHHDYLTAPSHNQVSRGSSYSSHLYAPLDNHTSLSRSTSHHHMHGQPPARFHPSNAIGIPQNYQSFDAPEIPYTYSGLPAPAMIRHRSEANLDNPSPRLVRNISTEGNSATPVEDDERTPVARHGEAPARMEPTNIRHVFVDQLKLDEAMGNANSRYECPYCGKGFNRPSSLKIHLNSHTGEKPFVCPVESCRRSFSVLSNMRRHARVHNTLLESGSSELPLPPSLTLPPSSQGSLHRRRSSASSSSVSRRSRSVSSSDDLDVEDHDEKRTRRNVK